MGGNPHLPFSARSLAKRKLDKLWAEGGIVVTAKREHGATQFVQLCNHGEMGGAATLQTDTPLVVRGNTSAAYGSHRCTATLSDRWPM